MNFLWIFKCMSKYTCRNKAPFPRSPSPFYISYIHTSTVYTERPPLRTRKNTLIFSIFVFHGAGNGKREGGEGLFQEILSLFPGSQGTCGLNHGLTASSSFIQIFNGTVARKFFLFFNYQNSRRSQNFIYLHKSFMFIARYIKNRTLKKS